MSDCFDHMQDAWDDALFGATANGYGGLSKWFGPTCKYCGQQGLKWHQSLHGWTLMEGSVRHTCAAHRGHRRQMVEPAGMFDDLDQPRPES